MKITRAHLRGMITEALQEMSMMGGPEEGMEPMEPGSAEEAGEQLLAIGRQIEELNKAALALVGVWGDDSEYESARLYWYGQIAVALGSRAFMSKSMHSLRDSANGLMGAADKAGYREEEEEEMFEARRPPFKGNVKGATFHQDPVTGEWVTGGEDFEGRGGRAAHAIRRPQIMGMKSPAQLRAEPEVDFDALAAVYGYDSVGEAFAAADGDPDEMMRFLQARADAAAEDEDF